MTEKNSKMEQFCSVWLNTPSIWQKNSEDSMIDDEKIGKLLDWKYDNTLLFSFYSFLLLTTNRCQNSCQIALLQGWHWRQLTSWPCCKNFQHRIFLVKMNWSPRQKQLFECLPGAGYVESSVKWIWSTGKCLKHTLSLGFFGTWSIAKLSNHFWRRNGFNFSDGKVKYPLAPELEQMTHFLFPICKSL